MKKLFSAAVITAFLFSCNGGADKGKFTLTGELKSAPDQKIYLEELFFSEQQPQVVDTADLKGDKFVVSALAAEEGLFRLRLADQKTSYVFVSEPGTMNFTADIEKPEYANVFFSGSANSSLKKLLTYADSIGVLISNKGRLLSEFEKAGVNKADSIFLETSNEYTALTENFTKYCFAFGDTAQSPIVSLFAVTMAPVDMSKFEVPVSNLVKRFPKHKGIANALAFIKSKTTAQTQPPQPNSNAGIGSIAPELTMNDVDGKPFSLSQLRGKYVLVDFWASWCGPCRAENPNVVAAYNQFKNKNFTVLGVSLDEGKAEWVEAIKSDNLTWPQISDLKKFNSAAVELFGFDAIPYNVLIDPTGKIIATGLAGKALQSKLIEVLK